MVAEVYDTADCVNITAMAHMTKPRRQILDLLEANGGTILDASGRASSVLNEMLPGPTRSAVGMNAILRSMEEAGLIRREIRSKRTYSISLVKADEVLTAWPPEQPTWQAAKQPAPEPTVDLHALADQMLKRACEILNMDPSVHEETIRELKEEMAGLYEETGNLRTRVAQAEDDTQRYRRERDRLASQVVALEANIDAMLQGVRDGRSEATFKAVRRFMQERPLTRAS